MGHKKSILLYSVMEIPDKPQWESAFTDHAVTSIRDLKQIEKTIPDCVIYYTDDATTETTVETIEQSLLPLQHHGRLHTVPIVLAMKHVPEALQTQSLKMGLSATLDYPITLQKCQDLLTLLSKNQIDEETFGILRASFLEEILEHSGEMKNALSHFNEESFAEVYRRLHTIKGGSRGIFLPVIGRVAHEAENLLTRAKNMNALASPDLMKALQGVAQFFDACAPAIAAGLLLPDPSLVFQSLLSAKLQASANTAVSTGDAKNPDKTQKAETIAGVAGRTATSVRITNEKIDELHGHAKKILQIRTQLSSFSRELSSEFSGEAFPRKLEQMVSELSKETLQFMDFFVQLRVVPASRVQLFAERMIQDLRLRLSREVNFRFDCDPYLEIDSQAVEILDAALTHILRNSMDHGLESIEDRQKSGKPPAGQIELKLTKLESDQFSVVVKDDGRGIDPKKVKASVSKKGFLDQNLIDKMSDEEALQLIFLDGVSTREVVSDLSGRGVGLGAVKAAIEKVGGKIRVESTIGQGSVFQIVLPKVFKL